MDSFSQLVKNEIIKNVEKKCCKKSFLTSYLRYNSKIVLSDQKLKLVVSSSSNVIIQHIYTSLKKISPDISKMSEISKEKIYTRDIFSIIIHEDVEFILKELNIVNPDNIFEKLIELNPKWEQKLNNDEFNCCLRSYFAALFICKGSVNSPKTINYHLEMQFDNENDNETADYLLTVLKQNKFEFKKINRKKNCVIYLKQAVQISDFIKFIRANQAMFVFEDSRISRDMASSIVRLNNIDHFNNQKTTNAAKKQIDMINWLKEKKKFNDLTIKTQKLASLRLENPEATFLDLTELMQEKFEIQVSKSGVNHYFREITKLYRKNIVN